MMLKHFDCLQIIGEIINIKLIAMLAKCFANINKFAFSEVVQSVAGHKAPALTDNSSGRYAGSLFSAASKSASLQTVLDDLTHLKAVLKAEATFREVIKNSAIRRNKQRQILSTFAPQNYCQITNNFLEALVDSGRLGELEKIIQTYISYCKILHKEEDIRIISAAELSKEQCEKVVAAIKKNKPDVKFKITYEIEPNILGGLQVFAGREFLDCSLRSRIERLKSEVSRIA